MALMTWDESLSVGIASIDDQHKKLVKMINDLYDGMVAQKSREDLGPILEGLLLYTAEHLDYEEKIFARTGYAQSDVHKEEHTKIKKTVIEIYERFKVSGSGSLSLEVLNVLRDWLSGHIQGSDKQYTQHMLLNNVT
ncbi:MAG: bacteriohemerythrin [Alphaproteobacteria bacterium]|nr:bacteriohemerythrin [Alphaproteobacteria bacterium]